MKKIFFLIFVLSATAFLYAFADDTNNTVSSCEAEISITLKEPAKEIKTNEPIAVTIQIKNTSTNEILMLLIENPQTDFSWKITSPSGKDLSPINSLPSWGSGGMPKLKPMESSQTDFDLSSVCSFNEIGTYNVIVKREVFFISPVRKKCEIVSSQLNIVISKF